MRKFMRLLAGISLLLGAMSITITGALAQGDGALVRFVHLVPGASALDVYINGELTIVGLGYGENSSYLSVPPGEQHQVTITPTGITSVQWDQDLTVAAGSAMTLIASSTDPLRFASYEDNLSPTAFGESRFHIIHAVADGPNVDILLSDGRTMVTDLAYGNAIGTFDVPSFVYDLAASPTGTGIDDALFPATAFSLDTNTSYMLVLYGPPNNVDATLLSAATAVSGESGQLRLVHGTTGVDSVDVYIDDTLAAPSLGFGRATEHLQLPVGEHFVALREAGADQDVAASTISVASDVASTAVILGSGDDLAINFFPDPLDSVTASDAVINVINAIPGDSSVSAVLSDGTVLGDGVLSGETGDVVSLGATAQDVRVTFEIDGQSGTFVLSNSAFYGGVYYNGVALPADMFNPPRLVFFATSVAQTIASAPGSSTMSVAVAESSPPEQLVATPVPTSEVVQEPTAAPPPVAEVVPSVPTTDEPTARVLLDPGANLQLRQYPHADALSLGLAPSGTILIVNGREGAPLVDEDAPPDAEATPFVDPATFLVDEDDDLDPAETWLNVTYNTPDGGTIIAWVNAFYLEVRDKNDRLQRLAELPPSPNNIPGEAENTVLTPPPIPDDRVTATVYNLDPDVKLNIRRTPSAEGERLEGLSSGTVMELLGVEEEREWAFIRYLPAGGGEITGWISTEYVQYAYNDRGYDLDGLDERELLEIIDIERRGEIGGGAVQAAAPTPDPIKDAYVAEVVLDPDANLNLRRTATVDGEVVHQLPTGTRVIVNARTADGEWLEATFENITGWIAADFVTLTFNGRKVEVLDVPLAPEDSQ